MYRARRRVGEPLVRLAPYTWILIIGGFWLGGPPLVVLACTYIAGLVVLSVVTLPVELEASRGAVALLERNGIARTDELREGESRRGTPPGPGVGSVSRRQRRAPSSAPR